MRLLLLSLGLCLLSFFAGAQELPLPRIAIEPNDSLSRSSEPDLKKDPDQAFSGILPPITMRVELGLVAVSIIGGMVGVPAYLFMGYHSYSIEGRKSFNQKAVVPYFLATRDAQLPELYRKHQQNRIIWYTATTGGGVLAYVGFVQLLLSILDPSMTNAAGTNLLLGSGLLVGGQVARVISFRQLRKAVNLYNYQYATPQKRVSLQLGLPSQYPAGGAVYLRF
ncbi:hypothetical protein [Telluribacter sp.]|jgi:hypothetical protein|uniref:hypothetical protein n=1 Tax=Telluribacter sp. TaxID=1978767 RepID=UPI002E0E352C|nr:hypothetical protein [Telluribacter sp.]